MGRDQERGQRSVLIEADGGSRGNPGQAAYGAVLMDAQSRAVIAEQAECIGVATNNVAEYRGLIAGLELFDEHTPEADLEVRMDSKLVVEQMSGNWKIKHPDMKPLAMAARRLAPSGTTYTWIPREQNTYADRILNLVLDEQAGKPTKKTRESRPTGPAQRVEPIGRPTTMIFMGHGETSQSSQNRSLAHSGSEPGLTVEGRSQVRSVADWLAPLADDVDEVLSSQRRGARESAEILAARLGHELGAEMLPGPASGTRDLASAELAEKVQQARDSLIKGHPGETVLLVTDVDTIKLVVTLALGAPQEAFFRLEVAPASVTVISWHADGQATLRMFNARPTESVLSHVDTGATDPRSA